MPTSDAALSIHQYMTGVPAEPPPGRGESADQSGELVGRVIANKYRLEAPSKPGGMGIVYPASHADTGKRVAVKLIRPEKNSAAASDRFRTEWRTHARMEHPNITDVLDAGVTPDGRLYLVTELVEGGKWITDYCDENKLDLDARLGLFVAVCAGMQHAHQKGVFHLDLKPSNVLVADTDRGPVPKVIDFGIAKVLAGTQDEQAPPAVPGPLSGTPRYMSPEQAAGSPTADARSDIYSLGALLYELLVGTPPFGNEPAAPAAVLEKIKTGLHPQPSARLRKVENLPEVAANRGVTPARLTRAVNGELDSIAMKALHTNPDQRYGSAAELARDSERYLENKPVEAHPPTRRYLWGKFIRGNRIGVGVTVVTVALLTAFAVQSHRAAVANRQRRLETVRTAATLAVRRGASAEAVQMIDRAEADGLTVPPDLRLTKARALAIRSDTAGALAELDRVPDTEWEQKLRGPALLLRGDLLLGRDPTRATDLLTEARAAGLSETDAAYAAGLLADTAPEALRWFEQAIAHDSQNVEARVAAAFTLFSLGRVDDLLRFGEASRPLAPDHPAFGVWLAIGAACRGDRPRAERLLADVRSGGGTAEQVRVAAEVVAVCADGADEVQRVIRLDGNPAGSRNESERKRKQEAFARRVRALFADRSAGVVLAADRMPPAARSGLELMWQVAVRLSGQQLRTVLQEVAPDLGAVVTVPDIDVAEALRRHPEGTLQYVHAVTLFTASDLASDWAHGITPAGRRKMRAAGEAAEAAAETGGLFGVRAAALEVAYAAYAAAGAPTTDQPAGDPDARARAGRLIRRRWATDPPLTSHAQLSAAAAYAAAVDEDEYAQLMLKEIGRRFPTGDQQPKTRARVAYHQGAYHAALDWLDKAGDYQADFRGTRWHDFLTPIRDACLARLGRPERAPAPRPAR